MGTPALLRNLHITGTMGKSKVASWKTLYEWRLFSLGTYGKTTGDFPIISAVVTSALLQNLPMVMGCKDVKICMCKLMYPLDVVDGVNIPVFIYIQYSFLGM